MPLASEFITRPIAPKGLETGKDPRLPIDGVLRLDNGQITRQGEVEKRNGYEAADPINTNKGIATRDGRIVSYGSTIGQYADAESDFSDDGDLLLLKNSVRTQLPLSNTLPYNGQSAAETDSWLIVASVRGEDNTTPGTPSEVKLDVVSYAKDADGVLSYFSLSTFDIDEPIGTGLNRWPICVGNGEDVHVFYAQTNSSINEIIVSSGLAGSSSTVLLTPLGIEDLRVRGNGGSIAMIGFINNGVPTLLSYDLDGSVINGTYTASSILTTAYNRVAVWHIGSGQFGFAWLEAISGDLYVSQVDDTATLIAAPVVVQTLPVPVNRSATVFALYSSRAIHGIALDGTSSEIVYYYDDGTADKSGLYFIKKQSVSISGGTVTPGSITTLAVNHILTSAPRRIGGGWIAASKNIDEIAVPSSGVQYDEPNRITGLRHISPQQTTLLFDGAGTVRGKILPGRCFTPQPTGPSGDGPNVYYGGPTEVRFGDEASLLFPTVTIAGQGSFGSTLVEMEEHDPKALDLSGTLFIPASVPIEYDGHAPTESGFNEYPEGITGELVSSGSSLTAGQYGYRVVYERTNSLGDTARSAPSDTLSFEITGSFEFVDLYIPTYQMSLGSDVLIVVYRTLQDGSIYYKEGYIENDPSTHFVTYRSGSVSDGNLSDNASLYTTGGVVENISPPSCDIAAIWKDRLFVVDGEYPTLLSYSKGKVRGIGIEFAGSLLGVQCNPEGEGIVALSELNDKLVVFRNDRIEYTYGSGLSNTLSGSGIAVPRLVVKGVRCLSDKSLARTPDGIIFQTPGNLAVINTGLAVADVDDVNAYLSSVVSTAVLPGVDSVYLQQDDNTALVYNWHYGVWSRWTGHIGTSVTESAGVLWRATGESVDRSNSGYRDADSTYSMTLETGWFSLAGLQGYQRVRSMFLLLNNLSAHTLTYKLAYDHIPEWVDSGTFPSPSISTFGSLQQYTVDSNSGLTAPYALEITGSRQKCTSVRLQVSSGDLEAYSITGIAFEVARKQANRRYPSGRRI